MTRKKRIIASITGSRADFGILAPVLEAIRARTRLSLQIYAANMHLSPTFGKSFAIVKEKFPDVRVINAATDADTPEGMADFVALFIPRITHALMQHRPDFVLLLGDRIEMLCAAMVCHCLHIPCGHIHGGEKTTTIDDSTRHAISKLSHVHFTATHRAAERLKNMGEEGWRIHVVGAPALDVIRGASLPKRKSVFARLGLPEPEEFILVAQHPVSEQWRDAGHQMRETLMAIQRISLPAIVIYPNSDPGNRAMIKEIEKLRTHSLFHIFKNLPHDLFLSLERDAAVWVGNSSAAMIESGSFHTPVVIVGDRQRGREHAGNILMTGYNRNEIARAIRYALTNTSFRKKLKKIKNPWGDGRAAGRIVQVIEKLALDQTLFNKTITY